MPGKTPRLSSLELRKQLLVLESEINRAHLVEEWQTLGGGLGGLADRAKSFNQMAVSTVSLLAGMAAFTRGKPNPSAVKSSWLQKLVNGAQLGAMIWRMIRSHGSTPQKKMAARLPDSP